MIGYAFARICVQFRSTHKIYSDLTLISQNQKLWLVRNFKIKLSLFQHQIGEKCMSHKVRNIAKISQSLLRRLVITQLLRLLWARNLEITCFLASLENVTRSGSTFVPGSGAWWTNGSDGSDGSSFAVQRGDEVEVQIERQNCRKWMKSR